MEKANDFVEQQLQTSATAVLDDALASLPVFDMARQGGTFSLAA